jgi:hypothetical protein
MLNSDQKTQTFPSLMSHLLAALLVISASPEMSQAASESPATIVQGVTQITSGGTAGPIYIESDDWIPIASASAGTVPSLFAAVRTYGRGRVAIVGHDGILTAAALDNDAFRLNMVTWLNGSHGSVIRCSSGHAEAVTLSGLGRLSQSLQTRGMTLGQLPSPITMASLSGVSVLIVGNATTNLSASEIEAIRSWVEAGGGLLMAGLGWSWTSYGSDPDINAYPMTKLADPFEARWLTSYIYGTPTTWNGSEVFDLFYPSVPSSTVQDSYERLLDIHLEAGPDLPRRLALDPSLLRSFVEAHQMLAIPTCDFPADHPDREEVLIRVGLLISWFSDFYGRIPVIDAHQYPHWAWLRERAWRTWHGSQVPESDVIDHMMQIGLIDSARGAILRDHGVLIMDNSLLSDAQIRTIRSHLENIPASLHNLRGISVSEFLGQAPSGLNLSGLGGGVNIFGFEIGDITENQFPSDATPRRADAFTVVVAHEINHIVDAYGVNRSTTLRSLKSSLIARAGTRAINYLRSMLPDGFFVSNPQEFVASIANQWLTSSVQTIQLGLKRFADGRPEPMHQALFMTEVYSCGSLTCPLYEVDLNGRMDVTPAWLERDEGGRIVRILSPSIDCRIVRTASGWVESLQSLNPCITDLDDSRAVDAADIGALLARFGEPGGRADLDQSGQVDAADIGQVLLSFGTCN